MKEIERKFLLDDVPSWLEEHDSHQVSQGYLAVGEEEEEVVYAGRMTIICSLSRGGAGETREEVEIALDRGQFEELWGLTESRRVAKHRFLVPLDDGHRAEVDVYGGDLAGLVVAEVEFSSEDESHRFLPPVWFGLEVTGDSRYANRELALHRRPGTSQSGSA